MTGKGPDPLAEVLAQMATQAAPFIRKAFEQASFKAPHEAREASADTGAPSPEASAELSALQQVILSQARRIAELEAEIAGMKARKAGSKPA